MRKIYLVYIFFFTSQANLSAQDKFTFPRSSDIGLNITNILSSFIGNSSADLGTASYPFVAKLNRGRNAARIGIGFSFDNSDETLTSVEQILFNNFRLNSRIGWERKKYIGNRFGFFYGLDLIGLISNEESTVSNNVDVTSIVQNTTGVGGGPVYGFEYYLNKYMYFGTEGNFYWLYKFSTRKEEFTFNSAQNTERKFQSVDAQITAPVNLYIMVRF